VVLSALEQGIKSKIEKIGTPLRDWEIQINYGIKTGFNGPLDKGGCFIITQNKRDELIEKCPKAVDIIRPILRGRDIQKYRAEWSQLYVIGTFPSLKLNIENFPAVKNHLLSFGKSRLEQSGKPGARKETHNRWFETQDSISYWDDFFRPKIIYPEITKFINFYFDENENYYANNKCFILTGERTEFLTAFLNSSLFKYCFLNNFPELLGGTRELRKVFLEKIPVIKITDEQNEIFSKKVKQVQELKKRNGETKALEKEIDNLIFDLYELTAIEKETIGFIEIL
jgi:hypothetical protein